MSLIPAVWRQRQTQVNQGCIVSPYLTHLTAMEIALFCSPIMMLPLMCNGVSGQQYRRHPSMMEIVRLTLSVLRVRNCWAWRGCIWGVSALFLTVAKVSKNQIVTCFQVDSKEKETEYQTFIQGLLKFLFSFGILSKLTASAVTSKKTQHLPSSVECMPRLFFLSVFQVCAILGMVLGTGYGEKEKGKIQVLFSFEQSGTCEKWNLSIIQLTRS